MLAIPLDSKNGTTLSKLFGNAQYFGLLDLQSGYLKTIKNEEIGNGPKLGNFLSSQGANATLFYHMGEGVYDGCVQAGLDVFSALQTHMNIEAIYLNALDNKLEKLTSQNFQNLLHPGDTKECKCGCNHQK